MSRELGPHHVSIVIPVLNEEIALRSLLYAIEEQTHLPDEVIFVDAASTDRSIQLIDSWWSQYEGDIVRCRIIRAGRIYPGAARNIGVYAARNTWVAFLDCGVVPHKVWLQQLVKCSSRNQYSSVFGVCEFLPRRYSAFSTAFCALSVGIGTIKPVIPGSLFHKEVFFTLGGFKSELRAAEDTLFELAYKKFYGKKKICWKARVKYASFPENFHAAILKYFLYEMHGANVGVNWRKRLAYLIGLPILYANVIFFNAYWAWIFLAYLFFR